MNEVATAYSDMIYFADQKTYEQWTAEQKKTHLTSMAISFTVSKNYGAITFEEKKKILEWDRFGHQRVLTDKYLQCSLSDRHKVRIRADHTVEAEATGGDQNGETLLHSCRNVQYVQACDGTTYIADQNGKVTEYGLAIHESDYRNWTDIISLSASEDILAGLHKNGTVSAAAASENLKTAVKKLNSIKQIACTEKEIILVYADELVPDYYGDKRPAENIPLAFACLISSQKKDDCIVLEDFSQVGKSPVEFLRFLFRT